MGETAILIGPADHGRRMSLEDFDRAEARDGHLYELSRGTITVVNVPDKPHFDQVDEVHQQLRNYRAARPGQVYRIGSGSDSKILLADLDSERHPDAAVYKSPPTDEQDLWATWIPDLVVEVVSPGSAARDYGEKREEYLRFGVREYWIIDAARGEGGEMLVLRRSGGRWVERVVRPPEVYHPRLFPGLAFDVAAVFRAAGG